MSMKKKAIIVLPSYNEREGIKVLVPEIFSIAEKIENWSIEILVVDDNSPDGTADEVKRLQKTYPKALHLLKGKKEGLGRAYVRGFGYAIENLNPHVLFEMDADGQHPATLIPAFLKKIEAGSDFVIGSRYIKGGSIPENWTIDRKFYSIVGSLVAQFGFMNFKVRDWTSGFRCIKASFLKNILTEMNNHNGYVFQIALLDKAFKKHLHISEVPLNFVDRLNGESKFSSIQFIMDALMYILFESSFVKFAFVGGMGFLVDFGFAALFIHFFNMFKPTANALSAEMAIIFNFFANNFWSFKHKQIVDSHVKQFFKFNLVSSGSVFMQWYGMKLALDMFGDHVVPQPFSFLELHSWMIYKVVIIACFIIPYSYVMYNAFIWKGPGKVDNGSQEA